MNFRLDRLGDWADLPFFQDVLSDIALALEGTHFLPPANLTFAALERTQPRDTRVVILGQDPYPTPGHAHGFSFSVEPDVRPLPRSLNNIFKELKDDVGATPGNGDLRGWADQGVLLLNTSLSVAAGAAGSHASLGWQALTRQVLERLDPHPRAFILWGRHAQLQASDLSGHHLFIRSPHPSPLSAHRGFFGSRPFSTVNRWLMDRGDVPIDWAMG